MTPWKPTRILIIRLYWYGPPVRIVIHINCKPSIFLHATFTSCKRQFIWQHYYSQWAQNVLQIIELNSNVDTWNILSISIRRHLRRIKLHGVTSQIINTHWKISLAYQVWVHSVKECHRPIRREKTYRRLHFLVRRQIYGMFLRHPSWRRWMLTHFRQHR